MRWRNKQLGDTKIVRKFLWFPTRSLDTNETRWLERATVEYKYTRLYYEGTTDKFWVPIRFIDDNSAV